MFARQLTIVFLASVLPLASAGGVTANTLAPEFPDWWKTPGDPPDGATRTQFHAFHSDPNTMPSPDWTYDGYPPAQPDNWDVSAVDQFDRDLAASSPFVDLAGVRHGDIWAKGGLIDGLDGDEFSKTMGNSIGAEYATQFHVEVIWMGFSGIRIDVDAGGSSVSSRNGGTIQHDFWIGHLGNRYNIRYLDGVIFPSPAAETFVFETVPAGAGVTVDSVYVGTRQVLPDDTDFNIDLSSDIDDLNALLDQGPIANGVPVTIGLNDQFDLTGDGVIDLLDLDQWLARAATVNGLGSPYIRGDADLNGFVDVADFNAWNTRKFTTSLYWDMGNFNGDAFIDVGDFNLWNLNKFQVSDAIASVPEPTFVHLLGIVMVFLAGHCGRVCVRKLP